MKCKFLLALAIAIAAITPARAASETIVVFFTEWSALIDDPAQKAISQAADLAKTNESAITVKGYADTTGSVEANKLLSATRAQVVADALAADGISPSRIKQAAEGETESPGPKQESRRVSIAFEGDK